jgi:hypothetical protein
MAALLHFEPGMDPGIARKRADVRRKRDAASRADTANRITGLLWWQKDYFIASFSAILPSNGTLNRFPFMARTTQTSQRISQSKKIILKV